MGEYYVPGAAKYVQAYLNKPVEEFAQMAVIQAARDEGPGGEAPAYLNAGYLQRDASYNNYIGVLGDEDDQGHWQQIIPAAPAIPADRDLGGVYQRERADPRHRMGDLLSACHDEYENRGIALLGPEAKGFYQWLDEMPEWERVVMIRDRLVLVGEHGPDSRLVGPDPAGMVEHVNLKPSMVKAFLTGVAYLDRVGRRRYKLTFGAGGVIQQNGEVFDTTKLRTVFSGPGFAIWVMWTSADGVTNKFYAGNHVKGRFHHSSFVAGDPVKCGGEMVVRNGRMLLVSAKSGHYQPRREHFIYALGVLRGLGVDMRVLQALVWPNGAPDQPVTVPAETFLANPGAYETWGQGHLQGWRPPV
jgi:hypothetical protein